MDKSPLEWYSPTPTISWLRKISIYQTKNVSDQTVARLINWFR